MTGGKGPCFSSMLEQMSSLRWKGTCQPLSLHAFLVRMSCRVRASYHGRAGMSYREQRSALWGKLDRARCVLSVSMVSGIAEMGTELWCVCHLRPDPGSFDSCSVEPANAMHFALDRFVRKAIRWSFQF